MNRRAFLEMLSISTAMAAFPSMQAWSSTASAKNSSRIIVVMLRGAADGLSIVAPYGDSAYYQNRETIAIPPPNRENGLIKLDNNFGLHPALSKLLPYWNSGKLAFVHAAGSPSNTRSHFEAQYNMECGLTKNNRSSSGWLNRLAANLSNEDSGVASVSVGTTTPKIFEGSEKVSILQSGNFKVGKRPVDKEGLRRFTDLLYAGDDTLKGYYAEGMRFNDLLKSELDSSTISSESGKADNGATSPIGFPADAFRLSTLIKRTPSIRLSFMQIGGWDTHINQGGVKGQLAVRLAQLGNGLSLLAKNLESELDNTLIVVLSEFGRTVHENGSGGTDHGHGNVVMLLGGAVNGKKVHGEWPGLMKSSLYEGRDLSITTDYREILSLALERHLLIPDKGIEKVFPEKIITNGNLSNLFIG